MIGFLFYEFFQFIEVSFPGCNLIIVGEVFRCQSESIKTLSFYFYDFLLNYTNINNFMCFFVH
jgi:hypothetical protein